MKPFKRTSFSVPLFFLFFSLFSYSLQLSAKTIVISDIDDTLKMSNSAGNGPEQAYHFLRKLPYLKMRDMFVELKQHVREEGELARFYYVSAAKTFTFNADKWISKHHFPLGRATLRSMSEKRSTYDFKYATIKDILQSENKSLDIANKEELNVYMFGDNAQVDPEVYTTLAKELGFKAHIFIRDVRAEATLFPGVNPTKKITGARYYFSEVELFKMDEFKFLSAALVNDTYQSYKEQKLIPEYTYKTLYRHLSDLYQDKEKAKSDAERFWNFYHTQF